MKTHCCDGMDLALAQACVEHSDTLECPDALIAYNGKFDEYGVIIRDGGTSVSVINFCPYCGTKLPESKRDLWFDTLGEMGFDDPAEQDIPTSFQTGEWYSASKL